MEKQGRPVGRRVRLLLLVVSGFLGVIALVGLYFAYRQPAVATKQVTLYRYRQKGVISYRVRVKPSIVYPETVVGPGKIYFAKLVEGIEVMFRYSFTGDKPASFLGSYKVTATLEFPEMWRKEFLLVSPTVIKATGETFSLGKDFTVDLARFRDFVGEVAKETGVMPYETRLAIRVSVNLRVVTAKGMVKEHLAPAMVVPLNPRVFKISGPLSPQEKGALTKAVKVPAPKVKAIRAGAWFFTLFLGGTFLLLLLLTGNGPDVAAEEKEIRRRYGDRLVQVKEGNLRHVGPVISLGSLADLFKVADELGKPLIYHRGAATGGYATYFVFDGATLYTYTPGAAGKGLPIPEANRNDPAS